MLNFSLYVFLGMLFPLYISFRESVAKENNGFRTRGDCQPAGNVVFPMLGLAFWSLVLSPLAMAQMGCAFSKLPLLRDHGDRYIFFAMMLSFPLSLVTFLDARRSGIFVRRKGASISSRKKKGFLNISAMSWGVLMGSFTLFVYPIYLANRGKLRRIKAGSAFFIATIVLGALIIGLFMLCFLYNSLF